jgi:hypothetical protein
VNQNNAKLNAKSQSE